VQRNARSAYDILVRPPGTRSPLELRAGLVQDNFLSGIYGGITLRQYHDIGALPGVAVAAPVANLGYITALGFIKVSVARYLTSAPFQAFRVTQVYSVGDGQHVFADSPQYVYLTRDPVLTAGSTGLTYEIKTGRRVDTCDYFQVDPDGNPVPLWKFTGAIGSRLGYGKVTSAFDHRLRTSLTCSSTRNRKGASVSGAAATYLNVEMPVQVTAIDPAAEDKLVGLDHAVISGRMLGEHQAAVPYPNGPDAGPGGTNVGLPVLQTWQPYANESIHVQVQRLEPASPAALPARLATPQAYKYLTGLPGRTTGSFSVPLSAAYAQAPAQVPSSYLPG
jgi:putative ABC transport system permease protein